MPEPVGGTKAPADREKALSVAFLRLLGYSQVEAGNGAGVSSDCVGRWEHCSWWPEILAEASQRWLRGLEAKARKAIERGLDKAEDGVAGNLALKVLERRIPELAPAALRADFTSGGDPLPAVIRFEFVSPPSSPDHPPSESDADG